MAIRFYKKAEPKNSPVLANGSKCEFSTLDHITGYFSVDNDYVSDELARLMGEGRYGMTEITAEEFMRDYFEKKKALNGRVLKPLWREEVAPRQASSDTLLSRPKESANVAAVDSVLVPASIPEAPAQPKPAVAVSDPIPSPSSTPTAEFKPTVAKRVKKPKV